MDNPAGCSPQRGAGRPLAADPGLLALAVLGLLLVPWFLTGRGGAGASWLIQSGLDLLIVFLAVRLARLCADLRPDRRFWHSVIIAGLACTVGDLYQAVRVITQSGIAPTSGFQTIMLIAGIGVVVVTMLRHPVGGTGRLRLRLWLDAATVLTAVVVFLWYFALAGALTEDDGTSRYTAAVSSSVLLLVAFATVKLILGGTGPFDRLPGMIGGLGLAGSAIATSVVTVLTGASDGRGTLMGQLLAGVFIGIGLRMQELQTRRRQAVRPAATRPGFSRLPYAAVIAVQVLLIAALLALKPDLRVWGVTAGVVIITALVLARQLTAFGDNERLLTELDHSMRVVRSQEERFRSLVQHASDLTLVVAFDSTIEYASPAAERLLGVASDNLVGAALINRVHLDDLPVLRALIGRLAATPGTGSSVQVRLRHVDGSYRWLDIVGTDLRGNPSVAGIVFNARDVTESRALHDELRRQATHDALTGLANRTLLEQHLKAAAPGVEVGVLVIDLDGFKEINDRHGHHAGDQLLVTVAQRLRALVGTAGLVARLGGDEFAVVLDTGVARVANLAGRISVTVAAPIALAGSSVAVGASVGACVGLPGDAERILRDADAAMYRDKHQRKAAL